MRRARGGDRDAFGILFERHRVRLLRYFTRMVGDAAAGEDLVQTTFERMLLYRHSYRGGSFGAWMYRIASNLAADLRRQRDREPPGDPEADPAAPGHEGPLAMELQALRAALMRLEVRDREVLVLAKHLGLRLREVAAILGCSEGAVKVRVHRALQRLRAVHEVITRHDASTDRTG
ncbi:MAG: RNA polymerase sigma factor [Acidobacteriota bacterium]|jgi:RNA polymerase sigma-70 factor (ECF subfamily)